ncbi:Motile sperm domain-containing protein 2 [Sarcoptes scabiei]|uniref:Motile sperm domain-containing protein 2 n=2 Tax=Sarcoptes scabiei TaxID=52283 RepID=A0A834VI31_SARSC|nr:Motile sperm domain-containing protein 2 [Sarcoptes scabiei]
MTKMMRQNLSKIDNLAEKISEIRALVLEEYAKNPEQIFEEDLKRIDDDWCVERFLRRCRTVKDSSEMLINTLKWVHDLELFRLKDSDFPEEFFKIGAIFCSANDRKGNGVVFLRIRLHRKVKELERKIKQFIIYQIIKMDLKTNGNGMAIVFDCKGAGFASLDMDMIWFLVSSLLNHFPYGMDYILVHELPWIFQSAWGIVKGWLPAETRKRIKFASTDQLLEYFDRANLPKYLGGTCDLNYHHVPKGCLSAIEYGERAGLTPKEVNRILKIFQPLIDEAMEEESEQHLTSSVN